MVSSTPEVSYSIRGMLPSAPRPRCPDPGQAAMDQDLWMVFLVKCSSVTVFGSSAHSWFQLIQLDLLQLSLVFRSIARIPIHNPQEQLIKSFWLSSYATQKPSVVGSCHHRNTGSSEPNSCLSNQWQDEHSGLFEMMLNSYTRETRHLWSLRNSPQKPYTF